MRRLASFACLACFAAAAAADPASHSRADKLFQDGRKYLTNGDYAQACKAFEQSQDAEPAIGTMLNITLCYEKWGHIATAYRAYTDAERAARNANDKRASVARRYAIALEAKIARVNVEIPAGADPSASYTLDGEAVTAMKLREELLLDAGKHVIEVRVAGTPPRATTIVLAAGERKQVVLEMPAAKSGEPEKHEEEKPEDPQPVASTSTRSAPRLYGGIALTAGGVVAIGIASAVALDAKNAYSIAAANCPMGMCASLADYEATHDARERAKAMTWVFAGGVALAVVGTVLIVTSKHASSERVSIVPLVSSHAAGLAVGGSL